MIQLVAAGRIPIGCEKGGVMALLLIIRSSAVMVRKA
jgi:hypothetical protein